jgi:hypothetical protein
MQTRISDDRSSQRLEELQQAINELAQVIKASRRPQASREPKLSFPFSLLAWAIASGLRTLDQSIGRLVRAVIR